MGWNTKHYNGFSNDQDGYFIRLKGSRWLDQGEEWPIKISTKILDKLD
jgi:hypothetical protein